MIPNRTIFTGDNLHVLRGLDSDSVDLVYLDPPFNSNRDYSAPVGSQAAGAAFKDTWTWDDVDASEHGQLYDEHPRIAQVVEASGAAAGRGMKSYVLMMASRLIELRRVLKDTGSIYVHCDPTANSYIRLLMDSIFGRKNMRNEIVWCYTGPGTKLARQFPRKHDTIWFYSNGPTWTFNPDAVRVKGKGVHVGGGFDGRSEGMDKAKAAQYAKRGKVPESWWPEAPGNGLTIVGRQKKQNTGYPTQKPLALLRRIIKASSNPGDLVLDPFCGCATTCVAAEDEGRRWTGIDISPKAAQLVVERAKAELGFFGKIVHRTDIPRRTDLEPVPHYRKQHHLLYGNAEGECHYCRIHVPFKLTEIDHVVARSKGGTDHIDNLVLACSHCNRRKGNRDYHAFKALLAAETAT